MRRVDRLPDLREARRELNGTVGMVPTMGALHAGHAGLMKAARESCQNVVVSIFVNPTQFGPGEDFQTYPRSEEADLALCRDAGVDLVWFPSVEELYPPGCQATVEVEPLGSSFEGEARPGHFRGVATVVSKLFHAVEPHKAFFGRKDLQQLFLIRRMVEDLLFNLEIVGVETARDQRGLALSSRNAYLDEPSREEAAGIYSALRKLRDAHARGVTGAGELKRRFQRDLERVSGAELERFDLLDSDLRRRYEEGESVGSGYCAVAVRFRGVRLIDNIELCC